MESLIAPFFILFIAALPIILVFSFIKHSSKNEDPRPQDDQAPPFPLTTDSGKEDKTNSVYHVAAIICIAALIIWLIYDEDDHSWIRPVFQLIRIIISLLGSITK